MFTKADKAIAGSLGGALAVLVNWALVNFTGVQMGTDELPALAIVLSAIITGILVYFVPNKQ